MTSKLVLFNEQTHVKVEKQTDKQKGYAVPLIRLIFPGSVN